MFRTRKQFQLSLYALALCSLSVLAACRFSSTSSKDSEAATTSADRALLPLPLQEQHKMRLLFSEADSVTVPLYIRADGILELPPSENFDITAPLGGLVETLYIRTGSTVTKGQPLARIQNPDFIDLQKDYLREKATLTMMEQEYLRQKDLVENQAVSLKSFQETESRYLSQKTLVKALEEKLRLLDLNLDQVNENDLSRFIILKAPTSGIIAHVFVRQGQYVTATQPVCQVSNLEAMELKLMIYQSDWPKMKKGLSVTASLPSQNDIVYRGTIDRLGVQAGTEKFLPAYCAPVHFDSEVLRPGLMLNALIPYDQSNGWRLPVEGLVRTGEKALVFYQKVPDTLGVEEVHVRILKDSVAYITFKNNFEPRHKKFVVKGAYSLYSVWMKGGL
jgi:cobalt-zinc-cadmium efflux system membrane fusion protein